MILSSKTYDILKWGTMIALPAVGTLYFTLSQIWGLPYGEEVTGTALAATTFFGILLGVSTRNYNKQNL